MDETLLAALAVAVSMGIPVAMWAWKVSVSLAVLKVDVKAIKHHLGLDD